jgi:hypothetical protein
METSKQKSPTLPYDAPAVVYEVTLVAHAGSTVTYPFPCAGTCSGGSGDVLDPNAVN